MSLYQSLIRFLEANMLSCPIKKSFGVDCMGCGMQRSFVWLLKGEWQQSVTTYPALIPMLFMFLFLGVHLKYRFQKGHKVLLCMFILTSVIVLISFIFKLIFSH